MTLLRYLEVLQVVVGVLLTIRRTLITQIRLGTLVGTSACHTSLTRFVFTFVYSYALVLASATSTIRKLLTLCVLIDVFIFARVLNDKSRRLLLGSARHRRRVYHWNSWWQAISASVSLL